MKKHFPSGITAYCRLALKLGSGFFLLFFACFSPIAPMLVQAGSAIFIFLVIILSPFAPDKSNLTEHTTPEEKQSVYTQIENDSTEHQLAMLQRNLQQSFCLPTTPAAEKSIGIKLPELRRFSTGIIVYTLQKPEKWHNTCQPVRAGPEELILSV